MSALNRFAVLIVTGLFAQAASAGPACMGNQPHMPGAYYPGGPMMPHAAYRPGPPAAYRAGPAPYMPMMAQPYQRPFVAYGSYPNANARTTAPVVNEAAPASSGLQAVNSMSEPAGDNITVRIDGMRFEPSVLTVKPGTTVTWIQGSSMPHTVTGNAEGPRSDTLYNGQQFSHTFDASGRFDYACNFHPSMKGSVIVEPSGQDT